MKTFKNIVLEISIPERKRSLALLNPVSQVGHDDLGGRSMSSGRKEPKSYNLAEAKKQLSELVGRVAFSNERVLITRRSRPIAELVPPDEPETHAHLADVKGWL